MNRTRRLTSLITGSILTMSALAPVAAATPPDHVLERAREAVTIGQENAIIIGLAESSQENRAQGLERAGEALAAAAERLAAQGTHPGIGHAYGKGHAADVHAILLAGGSPSDLPPHGETVRGLAAAFAEVRADHPGLGLGLDNPNKGQDDVDDVD